jgi:ribosomal protein L13E
MDGDPPVGVLSGELRSAGMSAEQAELLDAAISRRRMCWPTRTRAR